METKYCNTLVSSREDSKLAFTDNIYDKEIEQMQNIINKRFIQFMESLGINITVNVNGQHIWTVGQAQYILTPYTEAAAITKTEYDKPIITGFSYRNAVSNNGGKASVGSLTFTQKVTYTWNNGTQTFGTINGNLDTEALEVSYTISDILNNASVDEFGNVEADASSVGNSRVICKITPQITINGKTSSNISVFAEVSQAAAVCTFVGGGTTYTKSNVDATGTNFSVILSKSDGVLINSISDDSDGITASIEDDGSINIEVFENEDSTQNREMHVTIVTNINTLTITVTQNKAREATIVSTEYSNPVIKSIVYNGNVSNEGEAASVKTLTFEQDVTYTWSNGETTTTTNSGNFTTGDASFTYNLENSYNGGYVSSNGNVTANPSESSVEKNVGVVTPQVTWHGKTSNNTTVKATVKQSAAVVKFSNNSTTYNKSVSYEANSFSVSIVKSSGVTIGTITVVPSAVASATYDNNEISVSVNANNITSPRNAVVTISTNIGNLTINITQEALVIQKYFYIGQTTDTLAGFASLSNSAIQSLVTKTNVNSGTKGTGTVAGIDVTNYYKHNVYLTGSIFFILVPSDVNVGAAELITGVLDTPYNNSEITDDSVWRATHSTVIIDGVSYNVYGVRNPSLAGNYMNIYVN